MNNYKLYPQEDNILDEQQIYKQLSYKVWFIADTHFFHSNIIKYCERPFENVDEMNKTLITNWNKVVSKNDKVFMVGDFALTNSQKIIETGLQLNGRKTLILGNHDNANKLVYYEAGFEYISLYPVLFENFFIISHEPQFITKNGVYVNIFGHVHNNPIYTKVSNRSFCVSAECIEYTPIEFNTIIKIIMEK